MARVAPGPRLRAQVASARRYGKEPLASSPWWTLFGVYDDNEKPFIAHVQAPSKQDARSKALRKADGVILIAGIAPGKIEGASVDDLDDVVPIRGKEHAIEVVHVRCVKKKIVIPGRCPRCRSDLRRASALVESLLDERRWMAHLSWDDKNVSAERDGVRLPQGTTISRVRIKCAKCDASIWDGLHDE